jgi:hypothetical protein
VANRPQVDGQLEEKCWAGAPAMRLARALKGKAPAAQPAEVKAVRHDGTLYLAVRCTEPNPDKIRAQRRAHDGEVWNDDSVEVFLGVGGTYYHLGVNAAGSTYDGRAKDNSWNSGLKAAAAKGEKEWTAELAVPLESMTGKGKKTQPRWTANLTRNRHVTGQWQESAWSPTYSGNSHVPGRFGTLIFGAPPPEKDKPAGEKETVSVLPTADGKHVIRFDLSDIPKDAKIYRADLLVSRTKQPVGTDDEARVNIEIYPLFEKFDKGTPRPAAKPLALRPPWFDRFDVTAAVRKWAGGAPNGGFYVRACPFINAEATCLDLAYEGAPREVPAQVTGVKAFHRAGQTFISWKEISDPVGTDEVKWGRMKQILDQLDKSRRLRYCVYRSTRPITAETLPEAERIAVVKPLSGWNINSRNIDQPIDHVLGNQYMLRWHKWNPFGRARLAGK